MSTPLRPPVLCGAGTPGYTPTVKPVEPLELRRARALYKQFRGAQIPYGDACHAVRTQLGVTYSNSELMGLRP